MSGRRCSRHSLPSSSFMGFGVPRQTCGSAALSETYPSPEGLPKVPCPALAGGAQGGASVQEQSLVHHGAPADGPALVTDPRRPGPRASSWEKAGPGLGRAGTQEWGSRWPGQGLQSRLSGTVHLADGSRPFYLRALLCASKASGHCPSCAHPVWTAAGGRAVVPLHSGTSAPLGPGPRPGPTAAGPPPTSSLAVWTFQWGSGQPEVGFWPRTP